MIGINSKSRLSAYFKSVARHKILSREDEVTLGESIREGGVGSVPAMRKLVSSNLRFVAAVAKSYLGRGVALADLISVGNLGLVRAANNFNPTNHKVKFVSYAVFWIRQAMWEEIAKQGNELAAVSPHHAPASKKIKVARAEIEQRKQRAASIHEVAEYSGFSVDEVNRVSALNAHIVRLDEPLKHCSSDDSFSLPKVALVQARNDSPNKKASASKMRRDLEDVLRELPDKERRALDLIFGLSNREPLKLREAGAAMGLSAERVRQLGDKAVSRLQHSARADIVNKFRRSTIDHALTRGESGNSVTKYLSGAL